MRVALYDVDSKIPNLALMKLSAFHKERGDSVEPYFPLSQDHYDKIYASTIFNDDGERPPLDDQAMDIGGTGWDLKKNLPSEIERLQPDYSFYDYPNSI